MLTYAIGDIHGCVDQLVRLLTKISQHSPGRARKLVFLGDYIDRGPDSRGVIRVLRGLSSRGLSITCLAGNHEDMLLRAIGDRQSHRHWVLNGGEKTLESYGVERVDDISTEDRIWLSALPTLHEDALRYFVHAGLHPARPIEPEMREDRLWIRSHFLDSDHDFGKHVVHGHTPLRTGKPEEHRFRTNLDTGCVFGGKLTAGVFTDERPEAVEFIQVD